MSNQQINNTGKVPTSALVYNMQQSITKLNSDLTTLSQKFGVGSAIKAKGKSDNILYSSYDTGFYWYGASCAGAPSVYTGYMLVLRESATSNLVRIAFSTDGKIYYCVQSANGNVAINWKMIG